MQGRRPLPLVHTGPVHPHHVRPGSDVVAERTQDPLGGFGDIAQRGERGPARGQSFCIIGYFLADGAHLCGTRGSGGAQRGQRRRQRFGQDVQPAGADLGQHPAQALGSLPQLVQ